MKATDETILDAIDRVAKQLNDTTSFALDVVKRIEERLASSGVGVRAFVKIYDVPPTFVFYDRIGGVWRIGVRQDGDDDASDVRPWGEWQREVKFLALAGLPSLLENIVLEAKRLQAVGMTQLTEMQTQIDLKKL